MDNDSIKHTPEYGRGGFAPCGKCQEIIAEVFEPLDEEEIDNQISLEVYYEGLSEDFGSETESLQEKA